MTHPFHDVYNVTLTLTSDTDNLIDCLYKILGEPYEGSDGRDGVDLGTMTSDAVIGSACA